MKGNIRWTTDCPQCGQVKVVYEPSTFNCSHCGARVTPPYFTDGQYWFLFAVAALAALLLFGISFYASFVG